MPEVCGEYFDIVPGLSGEYLGGNNVSNLRLSRQNVFFPLAIAGKYVGSPAGRQLKQTQR